MVKKLTNADRLPTILSLGGTDEQRADIAARAARNIAIMVHNGELGPIDGLTGSLRDGYLDILGLLPREPKRSTYQKRIRGSEKVYRDELAKLGYSSQS